MGGPPPGAHAATLRGAKGELVRENNGRTPNSLFTQQACWPWGSRLRLRVGLSADEFGAAVRAHCTLARSWSCREYMTQKRDKKLENPASAPSTRLRQRWDPALRRHHRFSCLPHSVMITECGKQENLNHGSSVTRRGWRKIVTFERHLFFEIGLFLDGIRVSYAI